MKLTQRLLLGSLILIAVLVAVVVIILDGRLRDRLLEQTADQLTREARLVATQWTGTSAADALANTAGHALGHRVTLIDTMGVVIGDSEFDGDALAGLQNHRTRAEVIAAMASGEGHARRISPSAGDEEMYAAVRHPLGVARVAVSIANLQALIDRAERDVLIAAAITGLIAIALGAIFSRAVANPIVALRDDARAMAAGDLTRRPSLTAPGEIGDLATALHRLAEQLSARLAAHEAEEALLVALTEALNEGVVAVDARHQVVRINGTAQRLLGVRRPPPFPVDTLSRERVLREALAAALGGTGTDATEVRLGDRTVALTARPLPSGGAVLALFDLTTLRRLETVRRDFVANVSHELRTPLTVIGGFAETLADEHLPAEQRRKFVETVLVNAHRMQRIIDDLLDLSRIESGGWLPNPVPCDVRTAIADATATSRERAAEKGIRFDEEIAPDASRVRADPTALRQIIGNLVDNAVRHTNAGRVLVFARRAGDQVQLGVSDTGIGIAAEHLPRIFERFYRVDASRSREEGGTGLGLAIVRHLAEAHGGRVRVESTLGQGTTIWVELPVAAGAAIPEATVTAV